MSTPSSKEEAKKEEGAKAVKVAPPKPLLDALEEDDEFEEFEKINWEKDEEDAEDAQAWGQDWDDEANDDGFVKQLRTELAAHAAQ